jgi:hypothetical protein
MRSSAVVFIIVLVLIGGGYAYTYFQVKEASSKIFEDAEVVNFQIENISLIPPSADLTLYFSVDNPTSYGFTYSVEIELYIGNNYISTFQVDNEYIRANSESIIPMECRIGGGALQLLQSIVGDPVYRYEGHAEIIYKIFGIIPITIQESSSGYST